MKLDFEKCAKMSYKIPYICSKVSKHDILNPQKKQMKIISARVAVYSKPDNKMAKDQQYSRLYSPPPFLRLVKPTLRTEPA